MAKKGEVTSKSVASKTAKILANPKSSKAAKSVAASALTQRVRGRSSCTHVKVRQGAGLRQVEKGTGGTGPKTTTK